MLDRKTTLALRGAAGSRARRLIHLVLAGQFGDEPGQEMVHARLRLLKLCVCVCESTVSRTWRGEEGMEKGRNVRMSEVVLQKRGSGTLSLSVALALWTPGWHSSPSQLGTQEHALHRTASQGCQSIHIRTQSRQERARMGQTSSWAGQTTRRRRQRQARPSSPPTLSTTRTSGKGCTMQCPSQCLSAQCRRGSRTRP